MIVSETDIPASGRIEDGVHILPVRVYWEDTDAGGIVYHASFIRFMERGRTEMLRSVGLDQASIRDAEGMVYVVRSMAIDFLLPGRFDLALKVFTSITRLGAASITLFQSVDHGAATLARATVKCACIGPDGKPVRAPARIQDAFTPMLKSDA